MRSTTPWVRIDNGPAQQIDKTTNRVNEQVGHNGERSEPTAVRKGPQMPCFQAAVPKPGTVFFLDAC